MAKKGATKANGKSAGKPNINEENKKFLKKYVKKIGKPVDELLKELNEIFEGLKVKHKGKKYTDARLWGVARRHFYGGYKAQIKSTSEPFLFFKIYESEPDDYGERHYLRNLQAYEDDKHKAIKDGKVKVTRSKSGRSQTVIPYEERKSRRGYNKKLPEHAWSKTIGGLAIPLKAYESDNLDLVRPCSMAVFNNQANPNTDEYIDFIEPLKWYEVQCKDVTKIEKDDDGEPYPIEMYSVNSVTRTQFEESDKMEILSIEEIKDAYADFFVRIDEINDYHDDFADEADMGKPTFSYRLCVTEGSIIEMNLAENGEGSHRLSLDDESVAEEWEEEGEIPDSITLWVDSKKELDFGLYSEALIFSKFTKRSPQKDYGSDDLTEELGTTQITVCDLLITFREEPDEIENEVAGDDIEDIEVEIEEPEEEEEVEVDPDML